MKKIIWSKDYSVGVHVLDEQHKKIVSEINKLIDLRENGGANSAAANVISNLITYAIEHLSAEEDILIDADYPGFEAHYALHQKYRDGFFSMVANPDNTTDDKLQFLKGWWEHHILEDDMKYKPFLKSKQLGN